MTCPECTKSMTPLPCKAPINYSGITWEKWRCADCELEAKVEIVYSHSPAPTSNATPQEQ